ncbi:hypothetical protein [Streptomyces sp. NPDC006971]|uniref:hypothetical protein n=1 Tax=Streptomyces sp. NPDC006971 TaxID=3154784 RepID=UPI0033D0AF82
MKIRIIRADELAKLRTAADELAELRPLLAQVLTESATVADSAIRAETTAETLRDELARAITAAARAEGELAALRAQHLLDAEDRVALRMLLRTARKEQARDADRVYVLLHYGALHSVHTTRGAAEIAAEAEGAPRSNWTTLTPGAAAPPASEVTWRVQPLPLGGGQR